MKRFGKKMLAVLLSVLMVCTMLPFAPITAMADAQSDLEAKCAEFEAYVETLKTDGYSALKTNLSAAYEAYKDARTQLQTGTEDQMNAAYTALDNAMNAMKPFTPVTANAEVKIGTGATQPTSDDYANVIYSDGASSASWDNAGLISIGGTYQIISEGQYRRSALIYYPNTVVLNDGSGTDPMIPIIVGIRAPKSGDVDENGNSVYYSEVAKEFTMENLYENSPKVYLKGDWTGTNDGYYNTSFSYPYTTPQWPHLQTNGSNQFVYNIAIKSGKHPNPYMDGNSAQQKYWINQTNKTNYAIFKNNLCYRETETPTSGLSTVNSVRWLGTMCLYYKVLWTGAAGERTSIPQNLGKTKIYVINYELLTDALTAFFDNHTDFFTAKNAQNNTLGSIFKALDKATGFNPNDISTYNYANNMANAAAKAGEDIDKAVKALDEATLDGVAMGYQGLLEAIEAYEAKMNAKKMYTNMAEAYKAYLSAIDYRDAYLYGGRREFTPSLQEIAHNLIVKTREMIELNEAFAYEAHSEQAFDSDADTETKSKAYYDTYKNLLYVSNGPDRVRSDNASDAAQTANGKVLKINTGDYTETYLYVPDAVAVYDGYHAGQDIYTVPVLVGAVSQGGGVSDHDRYLYAYYINENGTGLSLQHNYWITRAYEDTDPDNYIDFNGDYHKKVFDNAGQTMTTEVGSSSNRYDLYNKIKNGSITDLTQTYIETASLNELLNKDTILESQYCINAKNNTFTKTKVANMRSDHGGNVDDPENYYANVLKFDNPFSTASVYDKSKDFTQFYYNYNELTAYAYGSTSKTSRSSSSNSSKTLEYLDLTVMNYYPIISLVTQSADLLTSTTNVFNIQNYQEGNLLGYFEDIDKLTGVSPSNKARYPYDNDEYTDRVPEDTTGKVEGLTGHDAVVQQNAYDMYQLFASDKEDVKLNNVIDENGQFDADYIAECRDENGDIMDSKTVDGGEYEELAMAVTMTPEIAGVGTCQDGVWWRRYDAAFAAGKQAMCNIADQNTDGKTAHKGFIEQTITFSYVDDDGNTITETANSVAELAEMINEDLEYLASAEVPRTRHNVKFKERQSDEKESAGQDYTVLDYDTGIFECANDDTHEALYPKSTTHVNDNTADISAYNALAAAVDTIDYNRYTNDNIIRNAKANEFDTVLTGTGEAGEEPQTMVDDGIAAMLTAINTANNGDYFTDYDVTFKCVDQNGNTVDVATYTDIEYGTVQRLTVPSSAGVPYKWVVTKSDGSSKSVLVNYAINAIKDEQTGKTSYEEDNSSTSFDVQVQDNTTVTVYCKLASKDSNNILKIKDKYNKVFDQQYVDAAVTADGTTLKAGNNAISYDASFLNVPGYTFKEFEVGEAKDGVINVKTLFDTNADFQGKYTIGGKQYDFDTYASYTSANAEAADYAGTATFVDGKYVPVSYNAGLNVYAFGDMALYDIHEKKVTEGERSATEYYVVDGDNNEIRLLGDYERLALANKLPFAYTDIKKTGTVTAPSGVEKDRITAFTLVTEGLPGGVKIVEMGTIVASGENTAATAETMNLDNLGNGIQKVQAPNFISDEATQYSVSIPSSTGLKARSYVKYQYTLQDSTIEAVIYGNFVEYNA